MINGNGKHSVDSALKVLKYILAHKNVSEPQGAKFTNFAESSISWN